MLDGRPMLRAVRHMQDERLVLYGYCHSPLELARLDADLRELEEASAEPA